MAISPESIGLTELFLSGGPGGRAGQAREDFLVLGLDHRETRLNLQQLGPEPSDFWRGVFEHTLITKLIKMIPMGFRVGRDVFTSSGMVRARWMGMVGHGLVWASAGLPPEAIRFLCQRLHDNALLVITENLAAIGSARSALRLSMEEWRPDHSMTSEVARPRTLVR